MTKLVLIHGIAGEKFDNGISAPVLALEGEETFAILQGLAEGADIPAIIDSAIEQLGSEDDLPPEFLWPMLFSNGVTKDSADLKGTTIEEVHDFAA